MARDLDAYETRSSYFWQIDAAMETMVVVFLANRRCDGDQEGTNSTHELLSHPRLWLGGMVDSQVMGGMVAPNQGGIGKPIT